MITFYSAEARMAMLTQFQYRAANYFYMIGMIAEPIVYLVVWSTIAGPTAGRSTASHRAISPRTTSCGPWCGT